MKTLSLREAAAFLHMHPEEVRTRAKRGIIPGAKVGRCWVFIEDDLAEFVRSLYPVKRPALPVRDSASESADRSVGLNSLRTMKEYNELLRPTPKRKSRSPRAR
jgi:Helix-turn-helix domain